MKEALFVLFLVSVNINGVFLQPQCLDLNCVLDGTGRKGHENVPIREVPYIAMLRIVEEEFPFCLGAILNHEIVLTTCLCVHNNEYKLRTPDTIEVLVANTHLKSKLLDVRRVYAIYSNNLCNVNDHFDGNDLAIIVVRPNFHERTGTMFIRSKHEDILKSEKEKMTLLNNCFGFGFGRYHFIPDLPYSLKGTAMDALQKYDYNMISDQHCDTLMPNCCTKAESPVKFGPKGLSCIIRGRVHSKCFGEAGSPIVCDSHVYGLLKGHMKCGHDVNHAGPDIMINFHFGQNLKFIVDHLETSDLSLPVIRPIREKKPRRSKNGSPTVNGSEPETDIDAEAERKRKRQDSPVYYSYDVHSSAAFIIFCHSKPFLFFIIFFKSSVKCSKV